MEIKTGGGLIPGGPFCLKTVTLVENLNVISDPIRSVPPTPPALSINSKILHHLTKDYAFHLVGVVESVWQDIFVFF